MIDSFLISFIGSNTFSKITNRFIRDIRVLAFHNVEESISFDNLLSYLDKHYTVVDPNELINISVISPKPKVVITFDDGFENVISIALPLLKKYGFKAILFICPGIIENKSNFWWEVVAEAFEAKIQHKVLDNFQREIDFKRHLKSINDFERRHIIDELLIALGSVVPSKVASFKMIEQWINEGMYVGNHTWDHPCLNKCDDNEQRYQIESAHYKILQRIGIKSEYFAYPNGGYSKMSESVLRNLGYKAAFLFDHKICKYKYSPLVISRLKVDSNISIKRFASILNGSHSFLYHTFNKAINMVNGR